jgi:hypothetical protein
MIKAESGITATSKIAGEMTRTVLVRGDHDKREKIGSVASHIGDSEY